MTTPNPLRVAWRTADTNWRPDGTELRVQLVPELSQFAAIYVQRALEGALRLLIGNEGRIDLQQVGLENSPTFLRILMPDLWRTDASELRSAIDEAVEQGGEKAVREAAASRQLADAWFTTLTAKEHGA